jgi:hypothetical protein
VRDLEAAPRDPKASWKADWQTAGISMEGAQVFFPTDDRAVYWSKIDFLTEDNEPVTLFAGDMRLELDPKGDWVMKDERDSVLKKDSAKAHRWPLSSTHSLEVFKTEDKEPKLQAHVGRDELWKDTPKEGVTLGKNERALVVLRNKVGAEVVKGRLSDLWGSIAKAAPPNQRQLLMEGRVADRYLLDSRTNALRKTARVLVQSSSAATNARDLILEGDWKVTRDGLEGSGPASITTLRDFSDAEVSFDVQPDDGPGVLVELGRASSPVGWRLPGTTLQPRFRSVVVDFDSGKNGGIGTCFVDELRLETRRITSLERVPIKISLIERTRATIKNLKIVELSKTPR